MSSYKVTFFNASFPQGDYVEIAKAKFDPDLDRFVDFDLNIGWAMRNVNSNLKSKDGLTRPYVKACQGFVYCANDACQFFEKQLRPAIDLNKALPLQLERGCKLCGRTLLHDNTCTAKAEYVFSNDICTLKHTGYHNHNQGYDAETVL